MVTSRLQLSSAASRTCCIQNCTYCAYYNSRIPVFAGALAPQGAAEKKQGRERERPACQSRAAAGAAAQHVRRQGEAASAAIAASQGDGLGSPSSYPCPVAPWRHDTASTISLRMSGSYIELRYGTQDEMKRVHEGKKPFYLKKSAQKTLELVDKCAPASLALPPWRGVGTRRFAGSRSFRRRASWARSWRSAGRN